MLCLLANFNFDVVLAMSFRLSYRDHNTTIGNRSINYEYE